MFDIEEITGFKATVRNVVSGGALLLAAESRF